MALVTKINSPGNFGYHGIHMKLLEWIDDPAQDCGIHFAGDKDEWTLRSYADIASDAWRVAALLTQSGAKPNEPVSLMLSTSRDFIASFFGALLAGATPSPIAPKSAFRKRDSYITHVAGVLEAARPSVVLADGALIDMAADAAKHAGTTFATAELDWGVAPDGAVRRQPVAEIALLQFTSGSSGNPRGVPVSPESLDANMAGMFERLGFSAKEPGASWLPLHHDMGLVGSLCSIASQADFWLMTPDQFLRNPLRWISCYGRQGATMSGGPSFGYAYAAHRLRPEDLDGQDLSGWRVAVLGAERIDPVGVGAFTALAQPFGFRPESLVPAYGMAEATLAVSGVAPGKSSTIVRLAPSGLRPGEPVEVLERRTLGQDQVTGQGWLTGCGPQLTGVTVDIIDEDGDPLDEGCFGEIRVRGRSVARGYWGGTGPGSSTVFTSDGLRTGDSGFLLDGELYVVGRIGDSIKARGRMVHAEDLEVALAHATGRPVWRCTVVMGNVAGTDLVAAFIEDTQADWLDKVVPVLRSSTSADMALAVFKGRLGCVERTTSGKPRRRVMWRRLLDGKIEADLAFTNWNTRSAQNPPWGEHPPPPLVREPCAPDQNI